jgi:SHS2 domain-containing protein
MTRARHRCLAASGDATLHAWGATRRELFENAALGLARLLVDPRGVRPLRERTVRAAGADAAGLLAAWLDELVYLFDAEGFVPCSVRILALGAGRLAARVRGERFDPGRHTLKAAVKAVTRHRLALQGRAGSWHGRVVLDL